VGGDDPGLAARPSIRLIAAINRPSIARTAEYHSGWLEGCQFRRPISVELGLGSVLAVAAVRISGSHDMRISTSGLAAIIGFAAVVGPISTAYAQTGPFNGLIGSWRGRGELKLDDGKSERLACLAFYTQREAGKNLGLAIKCSSASYTIELRSQLTSDGSTITGTWEERTFNASGSVTGKSTSNTIELTIVGGGFLGSMKVSTNGSSQSVVVDTSGNTLKGVSIQLTKG
jgi:hypothetical protein